MKLLFVVVPKLAKIFSNGSYFLMVVMYLRLSFFAISRKTPLNFYDFKLRVVYDNQPLTFYLRHVMDLAVLREIFIDKEYDWVPMSRPNVIIDLGAHFGDTALYYHARFPDAKIIAVEPSPENYERLVKHANNVPNLIPVHVAVGASDGITHLCVMPSTLGHSIMNREGAVKSIDVPQVTLATLLRQHGLSKVDLIKFDIEGAEFDLFKNVDLSSLAEAYIGELHVDLISQDITEHDFGSLFEKNGFKHIGMKKIGRERFLVQVM